MVDHESIPFIEETIQVWSAHRPGLGEENTVLENKGLSTSFTASPRTRHQLSVITAYNRLSSKSKMLTKLIEMEYAFVLGALDTARRLEEELNAESLSEKIPPPQSIFSDAGEAEVSNGEDAEG